MVSHASVGSLGIATYRILFVKVSPCGWLLILGINVKNVIFHLYLQATNWVKSRYGENFLLIMICLSIFGVTFVLSQLTGAGRVSESATFNRCMGQSSATEVGN